MEKHNRWKVIFWHICQLNNWKEVVEDQYQALLDSGLMDKIDKIFVTFLGDNIRDIRWLLKKDKRIHLKNYSNYLGNFERLCLNDIGEWSKKNDALVFYWHAKGVSKIAHKENVWAWRKMLEHFLVYHHEACIQLLNEYDTIGGNLCDVGNNMHDGSPLLIKNEDHKMHYSGNFWWSKTEYLRDLPPIPEKIPLDIEVNYWICERWILQPFPNVRHKEFFRTEKNHYYDSPPEENYSGKSSYFLRML